MEQYVLQASRPSFKTIWSINEQRRREIPYTASVMKGATKSQLFGKPCYKINGKAFCCFFQNAMVFKLPKEAHADAMSFDGAILFDPSGKNRPMKEWVQVPFDYKDKWDEFAKAAILYVG